MSKPYLLILKIRFPDMLIGDAHCAILASALILGLHAFQTSNYQTLLTTDYMFMIIWRFYR